MPARFPHSTQRRLTPCQTVSDNFRRHPSTIPEMKEPLALIRGCVLLVALVLTFSAGTAVVLADEPNVGILRVDSFQVPREVAPNSVFSVILDVVYGLHGRPNNATIRAAIYKGSLNFSDPLWQSSPVTVSLGGERIWKVNLTSPSTEGEFTLTAAAYFLDQDTWRFFNNSLNGPGIAQAVVRVGKTANLDVSLGVAGVSVTVDNQTFTTSLRGDVQTMLFVGNTYDVSIEPLVDFQNFTRIVFNGWSDGNNQTQRNVVVDADVELVGLYRTQYRLLVNSPVSPYSEWYDAGSNAEVDIPTSVPMNWPLGLLGLQYKFVGWTGDVNSSLSQVNVTMNSPKILNANFSADYTALIIAVVIALGVTAVVTFILTRRLKVDKSRSGVESLLCDKCGEVVENDWTHCVRCGSDLKKAGGSASQ
jgi:hypothetical protein